jgi:pentatricopeptide repeat protein
MLGTGSQGAQGSANAAAPGSSGSQAPQQTQHPQQPLLQRRRLGLAQSLRAFAHAAVAVHEQHVQQPASRPSSTATNGVAAGSLTSSTTEPQQLEQQQQQAALQAELESQLQLEAQQHLAAAAEQQQPTPLPPPAEHEQQPPQQQQQPSQPSQPPRRADGQLLLPLSAPLGPDAAAWNALVAALVKAGRFEDAADALERGTQASAAAGASRPPVEGYSALIRGYRRAGLRLQAVGLLRQFLNLGGRPERVMCDDVITLCLGARDLKTARKVVRAMEFTGCLDAEGAGFYEGWFARWEVQQQPQLLPRHLQQQQQQLVGSRPVDRANSSSSSSGGGFGGADPAAADAEQQGQQQPPPGSSGSSGPVAVERLKWWLGLPNSYYRGEAKGSSTPSSSSVEGGGDGGGHGGGGGAL